MGHSIDNHAPGLIDQLTISRVPVLIGNGLPLFSSTGEHSLTLIESRVFPSGLVQTTWRVER